MQLFAYKSDQGIWMRRITAITLAAIAFFASIQLYRFLEFNLGPRQEWLGRDMRWLKRNLFELDFAGVHLTPSLVLAAGLFFYAAYLVWEFLSNHERTVDFLVETEKEMKKVDWPTWHELRGSSIVVVLAVLFLGAYLFAVDVVLAVMIEWAVGVG